MSGAVTIEVWCRKCRVRAVERYLDDRLVSVRCNNSDCDQIARTTPELRQIEHGKRELAMPATCHPAVYRGDDWASFEVRSRLEGTAL